MSLTVALHAITNGKQTDLGSIHWDTENGFAFDGDPNKIDFNDLMTEAVMLPGGEKVAAGEDPQRWMESLHLHHRGAYFWADRATGQP